jgi:hypothetical protein
LKAEEKTESDGEVSDDETDLNDENGFRHKIAYEEITRKHVFSRGNCWTGEGDRGFSFQNKLNFKSTRPNNEKQTVVRLAAPCTMVRPSF